MYTGTPPSTRESENKSLPAHSPQHRKAHPEATVTLFKKEAPLQHSFMPRELILSQLRVLSEELVCPCLSVTRSTWVMSMKLLPRALILSQLRVFSTKLKAFYVSIRSMIIEKTTCSTTALRAMTGSAAHRADVPTAVLNVL